VVLECSARGERGKLSRSAGSVVLHAGSAGFFHSESWVPDLVSAEMGDLVRTLAPGSECALSAAEMGMKQARIGAAGCVGLSLKNRSDSCVLHAVYIAPSRVASVCSVLDLSAVGLLCM
jgi:hypothetical protein